MKTNELDIVGLKAIAECSGFATQKNGQPYRQRYVFHSPHSLFPIDYAELKPQQICVVFHLLGRDRENCGNSRVLQFCSYPRSFQEQLDKSTSIVETAINANIDNDFLKKD